MLKRFKLSTRIFLLGIVIIAAFAAVFTWLYPQFRQKLYDGKFLKTRHVVEASWGVLDYYGKQAQTGALSKEEAQKQALLLVKNLRYDKGRLFLDQRPAAPDDHASPKGRIGRERPQRQ